MLQVCFPGDSNWKTAFHIPVSSNFHFCLKKKQWSLKHFCVFSLSGDLKFKYSMAEVKQSSLGDCSPVLLWLTAGTWSSFQDSEVQQIKTKN